MRIFIGTTEIAGQIPLFAAGFRALGHSVTTGVRLGHSYKFDPGLTYDMQVDLSSPAQAAQIIANHDVFLFQFGHSLLWGNADFRMIRRAGKKIISLFNGSDVRYWPAYEQQFGIDYRMLNNEEPPDFWGLHSLPTVLGTLRRGELYADLILSVPNQSVLGLRPYNHFFYPADTGQYPFHVPGRDVPVVVHAPSKVQTKGTARILEALAALQAEGVRFELRLLQDAPHEEVTAALTDADCIIDQIYLGFGLFSVEGMASGCATATAHFPHLEAMANTRPVQALHAYALKESLRPLLTDRDLRMRLAREGREYVCAYHDYVQVCRRIEEAILSDNDRNYDYYPHYCATSAVLPEEVVVPTKLKQMSDTIVERHGIPHNAELVDMVCRGLLTPNILTRNVPRWPADVRDCARYGLEALTVRPQTAPAPPSTASSTALSLLHENVLDMLPLCLKEHLPFRDAIHLHNMLAEGQKNAASMLLHDYMQDAPASPALEAALGFLLWGNGLFEAASTMFSKSSDDNSLRGLLARWLFATFLLTKHNTRAALPLLGSVLRTLPPANKGLVYTDIAGQSADIPEDIVLLLAWKRPQTLPQHCAWVSPAPLVPDWYAEGRPEGLWAIVLYRLRCAGYTVRVSAGTDRVLTILGSVLSQEFA